MLDDIKCQQCGKCCKEEVCFIGEVMFETTTPPCPALEFKDDKYWCGVVLHATLSEFFAEILGIGKGCDPKIFSAA